MVSVLIIVIFFFFNDTATTEIYTLSLHDALPIYLRNALVAAKVMYTDNNSYAAADDTATGLITVEPSLTYIAAGVATTDEHTSEIESPAAVVCRPALETASGTCYWIKDTAAGPGT